MLSGMSKSVGGTSSKSQRRSCRGCSHMWRDGLNSLGWRNKGQKRFGIKTKSENPTSGPVFLRKRICKGFGVESWEIHSTLNVLVSTFSSPSAHSVNFFTHSTFPPHLSTHPAHHSPVETHCSPPHHPSSFSRDSPPPPSCGRPVPQ